MKKKELFLKAILSGQLTKRSWLISAFTLTLGDDALDVLFKVTHYDDEWRTITEDGDLIVLDEPYQEKPLFDINEWVTLEKGDHPFIKEKIKTTYGRLYFNAICLWYTVDDIIEYQNDEVNIAKLTGRLEKHLRNEKITTAQFKKYLKHVMNLSTLNTITTPAASYEAIVVSDKVKEKKKELLAKHKDELDKPEVVAKIEAEVTKVDKEEMQKSPSKDFYLKGKSYDMSRKKMYAMYGGEVDFSNPNKISTIPNSLEEGWDLDYMPEMVNGTIAGSYARGMETAEGGVLMKEVNRITQNTSIAEDNCDSNDGKSIKLTESNWKEYVNRYQMLDKSIKLLTESDLQKLIGKTITIRSPLYCKTSHSNFCKICMGDNANTNETALGILAMTGPSAIQGSRMSASHSKALKLAKYNFFSKIS